VTFWVRSGFFGAPAHSLNYLLGALLKLQRHVEPSAWVPFSFYSRFSDHEGKRENSLATA
jgi:hypothetical protein